MTQQITLQPVISGVLQGNPILLEVKSYDEEQKAKFRAYLRVQAFSDSAMIIGAYNTEYTFTIAVPQQFSVVGGVNQYGGEDIETLLQALQPLDQVLTDVEGNRHLVRMTQISPAHTGGQPYYYEVNVTFTDTGLVAPRITYIYGYMGSRMDGVAVATNQIVFKIGSMTTNYQGTGGTPCVLPSVNTAVGDCIMVTVGYGYSSGGHSTSVVDSAGNSFSQLTYIGSLGTSGIGANGRVEIWGCLSATAASVTNVITINSSAGSGKISGVTSSYTGVVHFGTTNALNLGNTTTPTISVVTTENSDWVVGGFLTYNTPTVTVGSGYQRGIQAGTGVTTSNLMDNSGGVGTLSLSLGLSPTEYSGGVIVVLRNV